MQQPHYNHAAHVLSSLLRKDALTAFTLKRSHIGWLICSLALIECTSCDGISSSIYDEPDTADKIDTCFSIDATHPQKITLTIDASDYDAWNYVSLKHMTMEKLPIPLTCEGEWDGQSGITYNQLSGSQMTPVSNNKTDQQPEPSEWDFAIHRFDVRTNAGSAARTSLTSIDNVQGLDVSALTYTADEWSTTQVMVDL